MPQSQLAVGVPAFEKQIRYMMKHMDLENIVDSMEKYGLSKNGASDQVFESYHIFSSSHDAMELYRSKLLEGFKIGNVYSSLQIYKKLVSYHQDVKNRRAPLTVARFLELSGDDFFWVYPDNPIPNEKLDRERAEKSLSRIRCVFKVKENHGNGYLFERLNPFEIELENYKLYDV